MKIAFVSQPGHAVLPAAGSIELWADAVSRRLSERHEVTIYASRPPSPPSLPHGEVAYRLIPHKSGRLLIRGARFAWRLRAPTQPFFASVLHPFEYWLRVARDIRRQRVDIVHVFNYSQALPFLRRLTRAKLVLHMHCEWLNQLDGRMVERRLRHADLIVGCSDYITDKVRERFPQHAARCVTIHNGVDTDVRRSEKAGQTGTVVRLLNVGRVSPEKGLHDLLAALELVVRTHPNVRLTILGEESPVPYEFAAKISSDEVVRALARYYGGSYLQLLRDQMSDAVAERVTFVNRVSHSETLRYYDNADIFVYPSIFESFAIPPVEAMAAGVPVVATRVGGMQETIVHEQTGLLVEREDAKTLAAAIGRLIEDPGLRRSLGEEGRVRAAEMFSWPRIVAGVEAAFHRIVEQPISTEAQLVKLAGRE
jgi:glycosyltransferase involved in cell wall biosynthesis